METGIKNGQHRGGGPAVYRLSRGLDLKLSGQAQPVRLNPPPARTFALKPTDIHGIEPIPSMSIREGARVLAGDPLFTGKAAPGVRFCSPVSGRLQEMRRGAKRAITEVVIETDLQVDFRIFPTPNLNSRAEIVEFLLECGAWVLMRQRPFNVMPDPAATPRDIFISCFDTAPLAPDYAFLMEGKEEAFHAGLRLLRRLTSGEVHLGTLATSPDVFRKAEGVKIHTFSGPHPAGLVGVQIHHVAPIAKGDIVWTVKPQDVAIIGEVAARGRFDARRTIALTGAELGRTGYCETRVGTAIAPLVSANLKQPRVRYISGNVLTGNRIEADGHLGLFDDQLTVIEEGNQPEFLGWLLPTYPRPSMSRTFLSFLRPNLEYRVNSHQHGEKRAFVVTGEYERVVPMDLYPQQLVKSLLCRDFERAEGLGIYEVVEEDLALCEFVCTSKQPVQSIVRAGLDWIRAEA